MLFLPSKAFSSLFMEKWLLMWYDRLLSIAFKKIDFVAEIYLAMTKQQWRENEKTGWFSHLPCIFLGTFQDDFLY